MKRKIFLVAISLVLIVCMFAGCVNESIVAHISDPIAFSGKLEDYAKYNEEELQQRFLEKHIEVTGIVTNTGYTLFYIGKTNTESAHFACSFAEYNAVFEQIQKGTEITVHGVCTSVLNNMLTLEGCQLTAINGVAPVFVPDGTEPDASATEASTPDASAPEASTPESFTEPSQAANVEGGEMVWIPTNGGDKYHTTAECSDMIDPEYVTIADAAARDFTPCSFCYG